jgi:hypothetical protein
MLCYRTIKAGTLDGLPYYQLYFKELRLQGTRAALSRNFVSAGKFRLGPLIGAVSPLAEGGRGVCAAHDAGQLKILIACG